MKNKKLLITLITILTVVFMMTANLFAAGEGSITITNTNTAVSISGNTFSAYKIFDVTYNTDKTSYVYTVDPTFAGLFTSLGLVGDEAAYNYVMAANPTTFAAAAFAYVEANSIVADGSQTVAASSETTTINTLDLGYYIVEGTATAPDSQTITSLCILNTTNPSVTVNPKLDVPTLDLQVLEDSLNQWGEVADYTVGEDVPYRLISDVPNMNGYTDYTFTVTNTLANGLSFNGDVTVTIGGVVYTDFTVISNGQTFEVVFGDTFINQTPNAAIVISYTATLDDDAAIFSGSNANTAYLTYSSNPYAPTETAVTPSDEVLVDTYRVDIIKYTGEWISPEYLAGAHFSLKLTNDTAAAPIAFVLEADGTYRVATAADSVTTTDLVSDVNGRIPVTGIDEGTYYLFETQAPVGYNILDGAVQIILTRDFDSGSYSTANSVVRTYTNGTENGTVNVQNNAGLMLPTTGGMGTTIFTVAGIAIMAIAATILVAKKKASAKSK